MIVADGRACADNGVRVTVMGVDVENNSYVDLNLVGDREKGVLCHTTNEGCCKNTNVSDVDDARGNWYFPNGSLVRGVTANGGRDATYPFFARNRAVHVVRLLRVSYQLMSPTERGRFYCRIPDKNNAIQTHYINICRLLKLLFWHIKLYSYFAVHNLVDIGLVTISPKRMTGISGETEFTLECSVHVSIPTDDIVTFTALNFEWFFGQANSLLPSDNIMISHSNHTHRDSNSNNYTYIISSTLKFSMLQVSDTGMYTCQLGGNQLQAANINVTVNGKLLYSFMLVV